MTHRTLLRGAAQTAMLAPLVGCSGRAAAVADRAPLLDVARGLLASWVVLHHVVLLAGCNTGALPWRVLAHHGQEAVLVFFILSGFAIATSLQRRQRWSTFLIARTWRIYPVYLIALALGLAACWYADQHDQLFADLGRMQVEI